MKKLISTYRLDGGMRRRDYSNLHKYIAKRYDGDEFSVSEKKDPITDQHIFDVWKDMEME